MKPTNDYEALVLAIKLGLTAETDEQVRRIDKQIVHFASISTPVDIELAKAQALAELETSLIKNSMVLDHEWIKILKQDGYCLTIVGRTTKIKE
jgi:hypothetical protein